MDSAAGQTVVLSAGSYEAQVVEVGGGLRSLRNQGYDVVAGYDAGQMCPQCRGQVLLPWPNRIEDGRYAFGGTSYQLGLSEAPKRNASHGLTRWANWTLDDTTTSTARWTYRLHPQPGYPFTLQLGIDYALSDEGLAVSISAENVGDVPAPYGAGAHPYLTVGRQIDGCILDLPAGSRSETDDRSIPAPAVTVDGGLYDFRAPRLIGATSFDHPFSDLSLVNGRVTVSLTDPDTGRQASMSADQGCRWLQVFSGDEIPGRSRESLAVEPMTCPPNAYNTGIDLVTLQPGDRHTLGYALSSSLPAD